MAQQYGKGENIKFKMEGPFAGGGGVSAKLTSITLPEANWKGAESPYSQVVEVDKVSLNSMVKFQLDVEQVEELSNKGIAFTSENDGGVVTVYAIGSRPDKDYTLQATITEVVA